MVTPRSAQTVLAAQRTPPWFLKISRAGTLPFFITISANFQQYENQHFTMSSNEQTYVDLDEGPIRAVWLTLLIASLRSSLMAFR
jgi:hypothetical protein